MFSVVRHSESTQPFRFMRWRAGYRVPCWIANTSPDMVSIRWARPPAVHRLQRERAQDEQLERALQNFGAVCAHRTPFLPQKGLWRSFFRLSKQSWRRLRTDPAQGWKTPRVRRPTVVRLIHRRRSRKYPEPFQIRGRPEPLVPTGKRERSRKLFLDQERRPELPRIGGAQRVPRQQRIGAGPDREHLGHLVPCKSCHDRGFAVHPTSTARSPCRGATCRAGLYGVS